MQNSTKAIETDQLVTFKLGKEIFAIEISKVQEVLHYRNITPIPNSPEFVEGVVRIRDQVLPVVDMRKRLGISDTGVFRKRIVVLEQEGRSFGIVVDDISQVIKVDSANYETLPDVMISDREKSCITKLLKTDNNLIIVISPNHILGSREKEMLDNIDHGKE